MPLRCLQVLKELVERCWHQDPSKRPSFEEIVKVLDSNIGKLPRREVMVSGGVGGGQSSGQEVLLLLLPCYQGV